MTRLFLILLGVAVYGQTTSNTQSNVPSTAPALAGAPTSPTSPSALYQAGWTPSGALILEPVALGAGLALTPTGGVPRCPALLLTAPCKNGQLTIQAGVNTSGFTNVTLATLSKPSSPPSDGWSTYEEWCLVSTGGSALNNTRVAWEIEQVTENIPANASNPTASSTQFTTQGIVSNLIPSSPPVATATLFPTWVVNRTECGGGPALMMIPANTAYGASTNSSPSFIRTSVQAVLIQ